MRYFYTLLFTLAIPFILIRLWLKGRKNPLYRQRWIERFGFIHQQDCGKQNIWLHAVSVGEVEASTPLIKQLLETSPDCHLILTTTTATGAQTALNKFAGQIKAEQLSHHFFPYDLPCIHRRFLTRSSATMVIIMETEIWPNLLNVCMQKSIPIILANARMAQRSCARYQRFPHFVKRVFNQFSAIAVQTELDQQRFLELGVRDFKVHLTGNLKCDHIGGSGLTEGAKRFRSFLGEQRPIWVAGSTHEGEETILLDAHRQLLNEIPGALLVLVPRHPERFSDVYALCKKQNLSVQRHSDFQNFNERLTDKTSIYLIDTMGELLNAYAASDIAFVAGTLTPIGGHNILEPAQFAKPILVGPETFKIEQLMQIFKQQKAIIEISDSNAIAATIQTLINEPKTALDLGLKAQQILRANQGATQKHMDVIKRILQQKG